MFARLYGLLWLALNLLASVYELLHWLGWRLQAARLWSYDRCRSRASRARSDREFLERCRAQLGKLPRHLSVVVGPDDALVDAALLRRLFSYAAIMDIDCVSVYDTRLQPVRLDKVGGGLKALSGVEALENRRYRWAVSNEAATAETAVVNNGKQKGATNGSVPNGSVATTTAAVAASNGNGNCAPLSHSNLDKSLEVYQITAHDGRPLIAEVCRQLFAQRNNADVQELLKDRTRLAQRIDDELSRRLNKMPPPELSIIFNRHTCTFGLLPWQTRFTEFHTHETGRHFDAEAFAKVLYRYARCEQRWGK